VGAVTLDCEEGPVPPELPVDGKSTTMLERPLVAVAVLSIAAKK